MSLESNVSASNKAREIMDLITSEGVSLDDPARYFREVHRMLSEVLNVPGETTDKVDSMSEEEARSWERRPMPFGQHKDEPLDYLLFIDGDDFRTQLRRYLKSESIQQEQSR